MKIIYNRNNLPMPGRSGFIWLPGLYVEKILRVRRRAELLCIQELWQEILSKTHMKLKWWKVYLTWFIHKPRDWAGDIRCPSFTLSIVWIKQDTFQNVKQSFRLIVWLRVKNIEKLKSNRDNSLMANRTSQWQKISKMAARKFPSILLHHIKASLIALSFFIAIFSAWQLADI